MPDNDDNQPIDNPESEELQESIIRAGFHPIKRDSDYNHLETVLIDVKDMAAVIPVQY